MKRNTSAAEDWGSAENIEVFHNHFVAKIHAGGLWASCLHHQFSLSARESSMSRRGSAGALKGKHVLARRLFTDRFFEHFRWRDIDRKSEEISRSILQPGHVQQRQWLVL